MQSADFIDPFPGALVALGRGLQAFVPDALPEALELPSRLLIRAGEADPFVTATVAWVAS